MKFGLFIYFEMYQVPGSCDSNKQLSSFNLNVRKEEFVITHLYARNNKNK